VPQLGRAFQHIITSLAGSQPELKPLGGVFLFPSSAGIGRPRETGENLNRGLSVLPGDSRGTLGNAAYDYKRRVQPIAKGRRTVLRPFFPASPLVPPGSAIATMKLRLGKGGLDGRE